jgi:hypothetical protein
MRSLESAGTLEDAGALVFAQAPSNSVVPASSAIEHRSFQRRAGSPGWFHCLSDLSLDGSAQSIPYPAKRRLRKGGKVVVRQQRLGETAS